MARWQVLDAELSPVTGAPEYDDHDMTPVWDENFDAIVKAAALVHIRDLYDDQTLELNHVGPSEEPPAEEG